MKKFSVFLCTFLMILLTSGFAGATLVDTVEFCDTHIENVPNNGVDSTLDGYGWGDVNKIDGLGDYVSWTHNFDVSGWAGVSGGTLSVSLFDDERDGLFTREYALGWGEGWEFAIGEVDTGLYTYSINGKYLEDGSYSLGILGLGGDFYVQCSTLEVTPAPEPATMLLLGSGLLGLAGAGRKKFFKKKK